MKKCLFGLMVVASLSPFISESSALEKCSTEARKVSIAEKNVARAESQVVRAEDRMDSTQTKGELRLATMDGAVVQAKANLTVAKGQSGGETIKCLFSSNPNCVANLISKVVRLITKAEARVKSAEARKESYARAFSSQMARMAERILVQKQTVIDKQAILTSTQSAYNTCLAS